MKTKIIKSVINEVQPVYTLGIKDQDTIFYLTNELTTDYKFIFVDNSHYQNILWYNHVSDVTTLLTDNISKEYKDECLLIKKYRHSIEMIYLPPLLSRPNPEPSWCRSPKGRIEKLKSQMKVRA